MTTSREIYIKRKRRYEKLLIKQIKFINRIMISRLLTFIISGLFAIYFYLRGEYYLGSSIVIAGTILFSYLVHVHGKLLYNKESTAYMCKINEDSIKRVDGLWNTFEDNGEEFLQEDHSYIKDLDIFGKNSLFQCINNTNTNKGRNKLKESLSSCKYTLEQINERQQAIIELTKYISFRQRLNAEGMMGKNKIKKTEDINDLNEMKDSYLNNKTLSVLIYLLPIITIAAGIIYFTTKEISYRITLAMIAVQILILIPTTKKNNQRLNSVYSYKDAIFAYSNMLKVIEKRTFKSKLLINLKNKLLNKDNNSATEQIEKLSKLVNIISDRRNMLYILMNIILLWDFRCLIQFNKWIEKSGNSLYDWIDTVGTFEELSSLSILSCDNPTWIIPELKEDNLMYNAKNIGHPLLKKGRICNDFKLTTNQNIILITGSNMSGKSTLLRTAGINLVLAYSGAAVCADSLSCSLMNIYTCMRISDNLEENISSFYAELLRIKKLTDATRRKEPVFFLLDEIFRGTNSMDRHTAAMSLMVKLSDENILGFVSTHDLELGELEKSNNKIRNYHFREYYTNDKIHFDYKLRPGVSTTRNALFLMRMSGIEI